MARRLSSIFLIALLCSARAGVVVAEEPDDLPSTLSPRATKEPSEPAPRETAPAVQPATASPAPVRRQPTRFEQVMRRIDPQLALSLNKAKEQRTTGQLLVGVGSAALLASTIVWTVLAVAPPERTSANLDPGFGYKVGGVVTVVVGGLFAVPGAIVWGLSDRKFNRLSKEVAKIVDDLEKKEAADKAAAAARPAPAEAPPATEPTTAPAPEPAPAPARPVGPPQ